MSENSIIKKILPYTTATLVIVAISVGWTLFSRWKENRESEVRFAANQKAEAQKVVDAYGGNKLTILHFYASPGVVARGAETQLCYGVSNAKTVVIEPPVGDVWPSLNRCMGVPVSKTTTFALKALDSVGHVETQSLTIRVQ